MWCRSSMSPKSSRFCRMELERLQASIFLNPSRFLQIKLILLLSASLALCLARSAATSVEDLLRTNTCSTFLQINSSISFKLIFLRRLSEYLEPDQVAFNYLSFISYKYLFNNSVIQSCFEFSIGLCFHSLLSNSYLFNSLKCYFRSVSSYSLALSIRAFVFCDIILN